MKLKSIKIYYGEQFRENYLGGNQFGENYFEGNIIVDDNKKIEGIINSDNDMYICGEYDKDNNIKLLLNVHGYPIYYNIFSCTKGKNPNEWDVYAYNEEKEIVDKDLKISIKEKTIDKEIQEQEIKELKYKIESYKETYQERIKVSMDIYMNELKHHEVETREDYEKKLKKSNIIHYYI